MENAKVSTIARAIRVALRRIQAPNDSHYVHPTEAELANGALSVLQRFMTELPIDCVIRTEHGTMRALQNVHPDKWREMVDGDSWISYKGNRYVRTKTGHRISITRSFFIAFVENTTHEDRFKAIESYVIEQELLVASRNVTDDKHLSTIGSTQFSDTTVRLSRDP